MREPGLLCLQGGGEFARACRDLDSDVVRRTPPGPIVCLAAAAAPGMEYATASENAVRYYHGLVGADVTAAPDPREDLDGCVDALAGAALVVLPGGSPRRLQDVLAGGVGEVLRRRHAAGATLSGASAGAMVLCAWTLIPGDPVTVEPGLGLAPGLALPHYRGSDRSIGLEVPAGTPRWGLPECGGVLLDAEGVRAGGAGDPVVILGERTITLPRDHPAALPFDVAAEDPTTLG